MKKKRTERSGKRLINGILATLCILLLIGSIAILGVGLMIRTSFATKLPDHFFSLTAKGISPQFYYYEFEDRTNRVGEAVALDRDFYAQKERRYVPYDALPKHLRDAFIAIEDKRFYEHAGVDWYRTVAAGANYLLGFSDSFGASTVTQQLVKNLTGESEVTLKRKMQEILYALDLERVMDKSEILELYLNVIHFSENCDGIGAAAERYFSKTPSELTVSESATLAAIINNPTYYNPIRHPENNLKRRNLILREMFEQGYLEADAYRVAKDAPLGLNVKAAASEEINSWYADMVIEDVIGDLCEQYHMSRSAASSLLYAGGLQIYTAVEPDIQKTVEEYYAQKVQTPVNKDGARAQSSLIILDSHTGDVLGVAGGIGEKKGNRLQNFATQTLRPPGSALKPISVYALALEKGLITWSSVFDDVPVNFGESGKSAWPKNAANGYRGLTDVAYAVAESTNTVSVKILEKLGVDTSFSETKQRFHLENLYEDGQITDRDVAALALGQLNYGVTLRELASAYSAFADMGAYHRARSYYRVLDADGKVLLSHADGGEVVLSQGNAAIMTKLMQGVVEHGTASSITLKDRMECAGKTGTTNKDGDRWFVGYTPDLICGVWCGYEYPEPLAGKNVCLKIWDDVMGTVTKTHGNRKRFEVPSSLVKVSYCKDSGKLPCEACGYDPRGDRTAVGWFVRGTEPREMCDCHVLCDCDTVYGGVCHAACPEAFRKKVALIRVERRFPIEVIVRDAQYVYRGDPSEMPPNPDPSQAYFASHYQGFFGTSNVKSPYNRSCIGTHDLEGDRAWSEEWRRRYTAFSSPMEIE